MRVCVCARVRGCVCARVLVVRGDHEREKETLLRKHKLRVSRALAIKQTWPVLRARVMNKESTARVGHSCFDMHCASFSARREKHATRNFTRLTVGRERTGLINCGYGFGGTSQRLGEAHSVGKWLIRMFR